MTPESPRPWPGLLGAVVLLVVALGAQAGAAWLWLRLWPGDVDLTLLAGLANLTALAAVVALGFWRSGERPSWAMARGTRAPLWWGLVFTAVGGTVVLGELANLTAWLVPLPDALANLFNQLTEGPALVSLFTLSLVAPLTEETLFRGLLLRGFERRYGVWPALLLSSALFALFHLNVWQALAAFAAGLYLGWLYLSTKSLIAPMAAHALFNGLPVLLSSWGVSIAGYNTSTVAGTVEFQPWPWLVAGGVLLALGLALTKRWAPLPPHPVSDTVAP